MRSDNEKTVKRTIKDSVFSALFNEEKYLRQLCRVLKPDVSEEELDTISNVTIQNVLVNGLYNDLAMLVGGVSLFLFFCEAQSVWSDNIAYRQLEYYVEWTHKYVVENKYNLYGKKAVRLPVPRFYVVYTGKDEHPENEITLRNTNFGGIEGAVDVKVTVLHMSEDNNILDQYIKFAHVSDEQVREKGRTKEAIEAIIKICIENDILKEFLETRKAEVIDMLDTLFDQEYAVEAYGREEREEGIKDATVRLVKNLMESMGTTAEGALAALRIPKNEWEQYIPQLS